jgi:hypothetical protein
MGIPSQVEEAAVLAEKLHQDMFSQDVEEEVKSEDIEKEVEEEEPEVEGEEEDEVIPHDDDLDELRKFKSRYLSLKGKYDAEVPRLQHELKDLKTSVFEKLSSIAEKPAETPKEQVKQDDIITKMKEEYGEDFIEGIYKIAEHIADQKVKASVDTVQEKITSVEDAQLKVAQENFKGYLDNKITGDWRALWEGNDPKFLEYLKQPDPSGLYTYGDLVQMYNDQWDADKLAIVINGYLGTKEVKVKKEIKPNAERDALVAPSRSTTASTPNVEDKQIWTKASIKEFERLDRRNTYSSEDSQKLWSDLLTAASEGRIR